MVRFMVTPMPGTNLENCTISQIMQPIMKFTHSSFKKGKWFSKDSEKTKQIKHSETPMLVRNL